MKAPPGKLLTGLQLVALLGLAASARAQVYTQNIVGYIRQPIYAGNNFIANQLANSDNSLTTLFQNAPEGATFTEWDPAAQQFLPVSTYDTSTGWSINYTLTYGQGGLFDSPVTFTNVFAGTVWPGFDPTAPFVPPPVAGSGKLLLSSVIPIDASFYDVVGRNPFNGDSVTLLDALSQTTLTTTFQNGVWSDGDPLLSVGQSAFFDLVSAQPGLVVAPEPSTYGLLGTGLFLLVASRNLRRKN
jgi:hypothetical protein